MFSAAHLFRSAQAKKKGKKPAAGEKKRDSNDSVRDMVQSKLLKFNLLHFVAFCCYFFWQPLLFP